MADLLINALVETKMYSVLERTALEQVRKEQNLGNSERRRKDGVARIRIRHEAVPSSSDP